MNNPFTIINYAIKVIFGKLRRSGYRVYPNGVKCIGCSDCKQHVSKNNILVHSKLPKELYRKAGKV